MLTTTVKISKRSFYFLIIKYYTFVLEETNGRKSTMYFRWRFLIR